jgi:hypothetical protein
MVGDLAKVAIIQLLVGDSLEGRGLCIYLASSHPCGIVPVMAPPKRGLSWNCVAMILLSS